MVCSDLMYHMSVSVSDVIHIASIYGSIRHPSIQSEPPANTNASDEDRKQIEWGYKTIPSRR
jgi:hypothetical protein